MKKLVLLLIIIIFFSPTILAVDLVYNSDFFISSNNLTSFDLRQENYEQFTTKMITEAEKIIIDTEERKLIKFNNNYFVGYIEESEDRITANQDTIKFLIESGLQDEISIKISDDEYNLKNYDINIDRFKQELKGIILGAQIINNKEHNFSLDLNTKLLKGIKLIKYSSTGKIYQDDNSYYRTGNKSETNSELSQVMELGDPEFNSSGYSIGANINWEITPQLKLNLSGENIISEINWNDVYTVTMNYDNSGTSRWAYKEYTTSLSPEYNLSLNHNQGTLGIFYRNLIYPYISYQFIQTPVCFEAGLYREFLSFSLEYKGLELDLKTRNLDLTATTAAIASLNWKLNF